MSVITSSGAVRIRVSGARGRQGPASGPLGAGSVVAENISDDNGEQAAILDKIGAADAADLAGDEGGARVGLSHEVAAPFLQASSLGRFQKEVFITDAPYSCAPGVPDITTPLLQAIADGAGRIVLPPTGSATAVYGISDAIPLPNNVEICGFNRRGAILRQHTLDHPIIVGQVGGEYGDVHDLYLDYNGTPVAGGDALRLENMFACNIRKLWIGSSWNAISLIGGGNHEIDGFRLFNYENIGLLLSSSIDNNIAKAKCTAGNSIRGRNGGMRIEGPCEGNTIAQFHATLGVYGLTTATFGSAVRGSAPWANTLSQCLFDSPKESAGYLRGMLSCTILASQFNSSGHDHAVPDGNNGFNSALDKSGLDIAQCDHLKIIGGQSYNNGGRGALLYSSNGYVEISGMSFERNQFSRSSNGAAVEALAGATRFNLHHNDFKRDADTTTFRQAEALRVNATCAAPYWFEDNNLGGCSVVDNGGGTNGTDKWVQRNA